MVAGEDGIGQVVEALTTTFTFVTLTMNLGLIHSVLDYRIRGAMRADHALRPSQVPDGLIASGVVDEILNVHHHATTRVPNQGTGRAGERIESLARL